jgi:hypothetical protein
MGEWVGYCYQVLSEKKTWYILQPLLSFKDNRLFFKFLSPKKRALV